MTNKTPPLLGRGIDINDVRHMLILARLFSQKAQAHGEMERQGYFQTDQSDVSREYRRMASQYRLTAKSLLMELERDAGAQFCKLGIATVAARDLKGSQFKEWSSYETVFLGRADRVDRWSQ